ncbi:hypothetical protein B0H34DRAFT_684504 [Crassisporium funariophilum]|nr:hypothetical protein B0H34DRAFT_684504 [Crassisporium funariophilum]
MLYSVLHRPSQFSIMPRTRKHITNHKIEREPRELAPDGEEDNQRVECEAVDSEVAQREDDREGPEYFPSSQESYSEQSSSQSQEWTCSQGSDDSTSSAYSYYRSSREDDNEYVPANITLSYELPDLEDQAPELNSPLSPLGSSTTGDDDDPAALPKILKQEERSGTPRGRKKITPLFLPSSPF